MQIGDEYHMGMWDANACAYVGVDSPATPCAVGPVVHSLVRAYPPVQCVLTTSLPTNTSADTLRVEYTVELIVPPGCELRGFEPGKPVHSNTAASSGPCDWAAVLVRRVESELGEYLPVSVTRMTPCSNTETDKGVTTAKVSGIQGRRTLHCQEMVACMPSSMPLCMLICTLIVSCVPVCMCRLL